MTEAQIYDAFIMEGTNDFQFVTQTLRRHGAGWCVIGGMAVNAYASPVYTADLDIVVVAADLVPVLKDLAAADFRIKEYPYSINAQRRAGPTEKARDKLMVQFSKAPEYQPFVDRAMLKTVLGMDVPVAALPDLVAGKLAAWGNPERRYSKHSKDETDLIRLGEAYPEIRHLLPVAIQEGLERQDRTRGVYSDDDDDVPEDKQSPDTSHLWTPPA